MPIKICPRCQQRFLYEEGTEDFEHKCNSGNNVLDQEDVVVIGNWTDYTGSGTAKLVGWQGAESETKGTRAGIEGEEDEAKTDRGVRASTRRQRQHREFIKL